MTSVPSNASDIFRPRNDKPSEEFDPSLLLSSLSPSPTVTTECNKKRAHLVRAVNVPDILFPAGGGGGGQFDDTDDDEEAEFDDVFGLVANSVESPLRNNAVNAHGSRGNVSGKVAAVAANGTNESAPRRVSTGSSAASALLSSEAAKLNRGKNLNRGSIQPVLPLSNAVSFDTVSPSQVVKKLRHSLTKSSATKMSAGVDTENSVLPPSQLPNNTSATITTQGGVLVGAGVKNLKNRVEKKRSKLENANKKYAQARDAECQVTETISCLRSQQRDLMAQQKAIQEQLDHTIHLQEKCHKERQEQETKKQRYESQFNNALADLFHEIGASEAPLPTTMSSAPTHASLPVPASTLQFKDPPSAAEIPPIVASPPSFSQTIWPDASLAATSQPKYTATELVNLATDSQTNSNAKARLIAFIQTTPNKRLQKVFRVSSTYQARCLLLEEAKGLLRVLRQGKFHLRQEFRARMNQDVPTKRWLLASNAGSIVIGKRIEDMQERIVALLNIQD